MNDIRRTILWVIFGFSMVLLWDKWQLHNGNKATFFPTTPAVTAPAAAAAGAASGATGAASVPATSVPAATTAAQGAAAVPGQPAAAAAPAKRERIEVKTDLYRLVFDSEGGSLTQAELLKHADMTDKARNFLLLDESAQRVYVAQTGLVGGAFPTHKTAMTAVPGPRASSAGCGPLASRGRGDDELGDVLRRGPVRTPSPGGVVLRRCAARSESVHRPGRRQVFPRNLGARSHGRRCG